MLARELLQIARAVAEAGHPGEDARLRSAANRAYYALFVDLRDRIDPSRKILGERSLHAKLSRTLKFACREKEDSFGLVYDGLAALLERRIEADYYTLRGQTALDWSRDGVTADIDTAEECLAAIAELDQEELDVLRRSAEEAAMAFERRRRRRGRSGEHSADEDRS